MIALPLATCSSLGAVLVRFSWGAVYRSHGHTELGGGGWVTITGMPKQDDTGREKGGVTKKMLLPGFWR